MNITQDRVVRKLRNLKPDKSPGPDGMHPKMLLECAQEIAVTLTLLFQESLKSGKIPERWRESNVVAIFKNGKRDLASNYRPVSLTCIGCQIMESLIKEDLV